jgi:Predicted membrane protein (DUF2254)
MYSPLSLPFKFKVYFSSFVIFTIVSSIILYFFLPPFAFAQLESVKFLLSSLIESEATVIAIVISLSLVVIQLTASSYSTRVIDIFKESSAIWIVIITYIIAIIYGMTVLKFIDVIMVSGTPIYITAIWIAYFLAIFAFGALIPYLLSSLDIMKSSTVINRFAEKITKENILSGVSESEAIVSRGATSLNFSYLYTDILRQVTEIDKDPVQPIIDIIHASMMKYDYETMRYGLKVLENYMIEILKEDVLKKDDVTIAKHIFTHLERVGKLAASRDDEDSVLEVSATIFMIGKIAVEHDYENIAGMTVNALKNICRPVIKKEMEELTITLTDLITDIGRDSAVRKQDFATSVTINSLGIIGKSTSKQEQQDLEETVGIAGIIHEIGKLAVKYDLKQSVFYAVNSLGDIGKSTSENNLIKTTMIIVNDLNDLGFLTLKENYNDNTNKIAEDLWEIGRIAVWNDLNNIALDKLLTKIQDTLKELQVKAQEKGYKEIVDVINASYDRICELIEAKSVKLK